jgi:Ca2+-binding RTX toxin-like protein
MNRLYILLTVMVVIVGALFAGHQALAKVLSGTAGDDTLVETDTNDRFTGLRGADNLTGRDGEDRLKGGRGNDRLKGSRDADHLWGSRGNDKIIPGEGNDKVYAGSGAELIYARDTEGEDYIDCGAGFDKVETIHRPDETLHNCERAPGPERGDI